MSLNGPIILVEDDPDDQDVVNEILQTLNFPNELVIFQNGKEAETYLRTTSQQPFLILCDINMPVMNGLELRTIIENDPALRQKSIPFVFLTTTRNPSTVNRAYDLTVQGFFQKKNSLGELTHDLKMIIEYWRCCLHPNNS